MEIYECRPGNMPEDLMPDYDQNIPFAVGHTEDSCAAPIRFLSYHWAWRKLGKRNVYSWCGEHPCYWRVLDDLEQRVYNRFISNYRKLKKKR